MTSFRVLERFLRSAFGAAVVVCVGLGQVLANDGAWKLPEEMFPQLEGILREALVQSPTMLKKNLERMEAEGRRMQDVSGLYPRVGGYLETYGQYEDRLQSNGSSRTANTLKARYEVAADYALYHWGAVQARANSGRIAEAMAVNDVREAYRLLALDIRSRYLQLVCDKASLRITRRSLEARQRKLALVREQASKGEIPGGSVAGAELGVTETELAIDRLEYALGNGLRAFRRLAGQPEFSAEQIPDAIPEFSTLAAERIDAMRVNYEGADLAENRVVLANTRMELERAINDYRISKVELRPKVNLRAGANQDEISYTEDVAAKYRVNAVFVGLRVHWDIFNGFASRGRTQSARMRMQQLEMRVSELREDLLREAENAGTELGFSARDLALAERRYAGAKAGVPRAKQMVEEGRGSEDDVIEAELALNTTELATFRVRATYLRNLASFFSTIEADPMVNALAAPTIRR